MASQATSSSSILHSDLYADLQAFSDVDKQRFLLFLKSPYFIGRKNVAAETALIQYLFGAMTEPEEVREDLLDREKVYQLLFPGRVFRVREMTQVLSDAIDLARAFVEIEMLQRNTNTVGRYGRLVDFFTEKGAAPVAIRYSKRLKRAQERNHSTDVHDFWENWQAESAMTRFATMLSDFRGDLNLQNAVKALETHYWIQRLDFLMALFNLKNFNAVLTEEIIDQMVAGIEQAADRPWSGTPLGQLCLDAMRMLYRPAAEKDAAFLTFFDRFYHLKAQVSPYHVMRFEALLFNFCIQRFHENKYEGYLLRLYENRIKPQMEGDLSSILAMEFLGVVKLGLLRDKLDFVQKFVEMARYKIRGLQPSEHYYLFGKASCLFAERKYEEARAAISALEFQDNFYKFFSKILEIKILYEGGEQEASLLDAQLHAFRMLASRDSSLSKDKANGYKNFHRYMSRLVSFRYEPRQFVQRLQETRAELEAEEDIYEQRWLLAKIEEILTAAAVPTAE